MQRLILGLSLALALAVGALGGVLLGRSRDASARPEFEDVAERANPAVVYISAIEDDVTQGGAVEPGPRRGEGTGFVVDPAGYIVTNQHVVGRATRIRVRLADRRELSARLVGSDSSTDIALLKVEATGLKALAFGDSDALRVGEWVCAIGNPFHFDHSVTVGVVSSKTRKLYNASFDAYIQTDAAINPGNSGGPLVNGRGEAVGVTSAMSTEGHGIGFAIPANVARDVVRQLREHGRVTRGYLGVQLEDVDPDMQPLVGARRSSGAVVVDVLAGAGARSGLQRYDVITDVDGIPVEDGDHLIRRVAASRPDTTVRLTVLRNGTPLSLAATLGERASDEDVPADVDEEARAMPASGADALGLVVAPAPRDARLASREGAGVVVREVVGLAEGLEDLEEGDLVVEVNRIPTPTLDAYRAAVAALRPGAPAWLFVHRPRPTPVSFLVKAAVEGER